MRGGAVDVHPQSRAFRRSLRPRAAGRRITSGEHAMSSTIRHVTFDCADPRALARFWARVTGWPLLEEPAPGYDEAAVGVASEGRPRLYFVAVPEGKTVKNR